MILEGIVTTLDETGRLNVAPMGPIVDEAEPRRFVLRPFHTSTTFVNLKATRVGVLHVADDVLTLARAAIGLPIVAKTRPALKIKGEILEDACRYYEFNIISIDESTERATLIAETVASGRLREFFGFNRAKHAVVEAAILATRLELLPREEVLADFKRFGVIVDKTGGETERAAFQLLSEHVLAFSTHKSKE